MCPFAPQFEHLASWASREAVRLVVQESSDLPQALGGPAAPHERQDLLVIQLPQGVQLLVVGVARLLALKEVDAAAPAVEGALCEELGLLFQPLPELPRRVLVGLEISDRIIVDLIREQLHHGADLPARRK